MACQECLIDRPGAEELPLEVFLDRLMECEGCPLVEGDRAIPAVRLLVKRQLEAGRALRRASNAARKERRERAEISAAVERYEARMTTLEAVHRKSLEETEREMLGKLRLIERQKRSLLELAAPVLHVDDGVVAVPLIGAMSEERAAVLRERLLSAVAATGVGCAILDLTGVGALDEASAGRIVSVMQAASLLGAYVVVSGLRGGAARSIVDLGIDLSGFPTVQSMRQALRLCRRRAHAGGRSLG